ncbi:hypothetical protein CSHISOI_07752, partial [Colletotrichum shisoi]
MNRPTLLPPNTSHINFRLQSRHRHRLTVTVASYSSSSTDEEPEHLPYPATKLIVAQYWHCSRDPPYWGYLIVGTFYDQHNNIVWSTEIFAFQPDPRRRQDTQSVASSEPDVDSASNDDLNDRFARSLNLAHSTHRPRDQAYAPRYPHHHQPHGQHIWNPALAGPVPGHWLNMSNPVNGHDMDPRRPLFSPNNGAPMPRYGEAYIPPTGGYGNYYQYPYAASYGPPAPHPGSTAYMWPNPQHAGGYNTYPLQPGGQASYGARAAQGLPTLDPRNPAAHLGNSMGGTGCEPGYNYFFPAAHTKIHVFRTSTPPWQLPANARVPFAAFHVPVNTTLTEVLKGFGALNPNPKKNKCFEIVQAGNGKWYKGLCFAGDDKDMMKKSIADIGWDAGRTGLPGQKPVVC